MQKLVLTTYRVLWRLSRRVDSDLTARCGLACSPQSVYSFRAGVWLPFDLGLEVGWTEPRIFLDNLIRRLNNGRQFYVPADPALGERDVRTLLLPEYVDAAAEEKTKDTGTLGAVKVKDKRNAAKNSSTHTESDSSSSSRTPTTPVPLNIAPYTPVSAVVRALYEQTPFSMHCLNHAFAAMKELDFVSTRTPPRAETDQVTQALREAGDAGVALPCLRRRLSVQLSRDRRIIKGLTDHQVRMLSEELETLSPAQRRRAAWRETMRVPPGHSPHRYAGAAPTETPRSGAPTDPPDATRSPPAPLNSFDDAPAEGESEEDATAAAATTAGARRDGGADAPPPVQLLLSHPQLAHFFAHTVLLVLQHTPHDSVALILNRPLRSTEGERMTALSTLRLMSVHPVFRRHLRHHTVMLGGPVTGQALDSYVFLLHTVPDVPEAVPVAPGLWLNGNLDALSESLDAGTASPHDIVVLCGFSGWRGDQLAGEVYYGTWVVAEALEGGGGGNRDGSSGGQPPAGRTSGPSNTGSSGGGGDSSCRQHQSEHDKEAKHSVADFLMYVARLSGAHDHVRRAPRPSADDGSGDGDAASPSGGRSSSKEDEGRAETEEVGRRVTLAASAAARENDCVDAWSLVYAAVEGPTSQLAACRHRVSSSSSSSEPEDA